MTAVIQMVDESETGAQNSKSILTRNDCSDITRVCHLKRKKGAEGGSFFAVKQGKSFKNK